MGREQKAGKHQYMTSDELAKFTAEIICKQVSKDVVIIDPCVGLSAIYKYIRSPKVARDIDPRFCTTPLDFLKSSRKDFVKENMKASICMNPPFRIANQQRSAVIQFLNHASNILFNGEFIVSICPQSIRRVINMIKINEHLKLKHEYAFKDMQSFNDLKNKKMKKVRIVVQLWQVEKTIQYRPPLLQLSKIKKEFELSYNISPLPHFFIRIWTTLAKLGEVIPSYEISSIKNISDKKWMIFQNDKKLGIVNDKKKNGTLLSIYVNDKEKIKHVFEFLSNLYTNQYWQTYKKNTYDGYNNPQISKHEIYLAYVDQLPFPRNPDTIVEI